MHLSQPPHRLANLSPSIKDAFKVQLDPCYCYRCFQVLAQDGDVEVSIPGKGVKKKYTCHYVYCGGLKENGPHRLMYLNIWSQMVELFGQIYGV